MSEVNCLLCHMDEQMIHQLVSEALPVSGTSVGLIIRLICSMPCRSGERPPWQQNIFSSIIAAIGKQLKQSVNVFHSLIL